jgi:hypothetical protein
MRRDVTRTNRAVENRFFSFGLFPQPTSSLHSLLIHLLVPVSRRDGGEPGAIAYRQSIPTHTVASIYTRILTKKPSRS